MAILNVSSLRPLRRLCRGLGRHRGYARWLRRVTGARCAPYACSPCGALLARRFDPFILFSPNPAGPSRDGHHRPSHPWWYAKPDRPSAQHAAGPGLQPRALRG